jgi:predicted nuclease with TOPRIM domain
LKLFLEEQKEMQLGVELELLMKIQKMGSQVDEMYSEYERLVMDYLEEHEEITNSIGRELVGIDSGQVMKNIFNRLRKKKLIEIVPGKSRITAAWRKVKSRLNLGF